LRKAWRLSQLGWTQEEIGERLGVVQSVVSRDMQNSQLGKMHEALGEHWNDKGVSRLIVLAYSTMRGLTLTTSAARSRALP
jgi:predicted transcriptional regulator